MVALILMMMRRKQTFEHGRKHRSESKDKDKSDNVQYFIFSKNNNYLLSNPFGSFFKTDADEDSSMKGDSQSSTETDSGVSEGCSDNGMSTEEEDFDNARGGTDPVGLASKIENLEDNEDMLTNGLTDNIKVCETLENEWMRLSLKCDMTQTEALIIVT